MNPDTGSSTIGSLLSELRQESSTLLRQEVALAKAELGEKAAEAGKSALQIATGGAMAYAGGIVLLIGVGRLAQAGLMAAGLGAELAQWLGYVLVGGLVAFVGWLMLAKAKKALSASNLIPRETIDSLRDNRRWAETKIQAANESTPENPPASAALRAEIDQTRHRMDVTIGALGERLKGRHLVDEALHFFRNQTQNGNMTKFKDTLASSADSAARSVVDVVKSNPVPVVLIGAGVALYFYNRAQPGASRVAPPEEDYRDYRYPAALDTEFDGEQQESEAGAGVGEKLQEIRDRVRTKARDVAEGARDMGAQVADRSRQLYRDGRRQAAEALDKHPLEIGLMCLAVGLLAGVALPTSEKVRRQVGPQARALRRRARSMVAGGRQVIRSAADAARHEAEAQGLTLESFKSGAAAVGRAAQDTAKETAQQEGLLSADPATASR